MAGRVPDSCDARKDDLVALALGEPLGTREETLRAHLSTCPACRAYLSSMARTVGAACPGPSRPAR